MTVDEIVEYVLKTPLNTNRAILTSMLEELKGSSDPVYPEDVIIIYDGGLIRA